MSSQARRRRASKPPGAWPCPAIASSSAADSSSSGRRWSGFGYTDALVAHRAPFEATDRNRALDSPSLVPMVGVRVKERLTGAIILVALLVLLVPELLT